MVALQGGIRSYRIGDAGDTEPGRLRAEGMAHKLT